MKVKSMRGKIVDMGRLMAVNAAMPALGNANMNAAGDIIGKGGEVVKTREAIAQEYHQHNPRAVKQVALNDLANEVMSISDIADKAASLPVPPQAKKPRRKLVEKD